MTSVSTPAVASTMSRARIAGEILRDIARGGIAGALSGIVIAGLGGRLLMRLAAMMIPSASGSFTENGNRIGDITASGSLALILFGGLFFGLFGGTVWAVASPWIPWAGFRRAILAAAIAVALTGAQLVHGDNQDFVTLRHDGRIVAMLVALVAVTGMCVALLDGWLDQRLPGATSSRRAEVLYGAVALAGAVLILPIVVQTYFAEHVILGFALVGVGLTTLAWWALRWNGRARPPLIFLVAGRAALLAAFTSGALALVPEVSAALELA